MFLQKFRTKINIIICIFLHISLNGNFLHASNQISNSSYAYNSAIASAIADIIDVFFIQQEIPFDILVFGEKIQKISQIIDEISERNKGNYATTIKWYPTITEDDLVFNKSAIVFFVDETIIPQSIAPSKITKKIKFFYFCLTGQCQLREMQVAISRNYSGLFPLLNYLYETDKILQIYSVKWWTPSNCNKAAYFSHNIFNTITRKWYTKLENHEHFENFHGCQLTNKALIHAPQYDRISDRYKSHIDDMFQVIGRMKNFTAHFEILHHHEFKFDGKRLDANVDIDHGNLFNEFMLYSVTTTTFSQAIYQFVTSPGELYTPYEKMLLPFDEETWWYLIATFSAAFAIISIINRLPKFLRNVFLGENVRAPAFNVVGIFFGIGQQKLPEGNFARIILMTFIFFCLIIRTAYQGVQYDMMTREMRRKPAQNIQQLYDENYTFWVVNGSQLALVLHEMIEPSKRSLIKYFENSWKSYIDIVCNLNSSVKQAVFLDDNFIRKLINDCPNEINVLPEALLTIPEGMATLNGNFFYSAVEEALQLTIPMGIPQYNLENYYKLRLNLTTHIIVESQPQVLTLEGLSFGFVICLVACGVSTCGLLCELFVFFVTKLLRKSRIQPDENPEIKIDPVENLENQQNPDENLVIELDFENALDIAVLNEIDEEENLNQEQNDQNPLQQQEDGRVNRRNSRISADIDAILIHDSLRIRNSSDQDQIQVKIIEKIPDFNEIPKSHQEIVIEKVDHENQEFQQDVMIEIEPNQVVNKNRNNFDEIIVDDMEIQDYPESSQEVKIEDWMSKLAAETEE